MSAVGDSDREMAGRCADLLEQLEQRGGSARDLGLRLGWDTETTRSVLQQLRRDLGPKLRHNGVMGTWWLQGVGGS